MSEPMTMTQEDAKAWYEDFKSTKHDSTAVIMTPGAYSYAEGIRFKTKKDIQDAVKHSPRIVPVYCAHDEKKLMGAAYNIRVNAEGKALADIYHEQGLKSGDGVSPGFTTREVQCNEGICQADMKIFHVAADPSLDPRHEENRVIHGDSKMAEDATKLKTELDAKNAEIERIKADSAKIAKDAADFKQRLDEIEKKEKEALRTSIVSRLKKDAVVNLDSVTSDGLKTIVACLDAHDGTAQPKPFFETTGPKAEPIRGNI